MARIKPPSAFSSTMAARGVTFGASSAPCVAVVGSPVARNVTMAYRNTLPIMPRNRRAVSRRPLFSMRFRSWRISAAVTCVIGRFASGAARSSSSQRFLLIVEAAASLSCLLARYSAAMAPNVLFADITAAAFACFRCSPGSTRLSSSFLACSRRSRASASFTIG